MSVSRVLHRAEVRMSADQSCPGVAYTTLSWNTEDYDTDAYHDAVSPTRLTVPPMLTGWYHVQGNINWAYNAGDLLPRNIAIARNGSAVFASQVSATMPGGGASNYCMGVSKLIYLATSDYVEIYVLNLEATARLVKATQGITWFQLARLGSG